MMYPYDQEREENDPYPFDSEIDKRFEEVIWGGIPPDEVYAFMSWGEQMVLYHRPVESAWERAER